MPETFPTLSVGPVTVNPSPAYDPSIRSQSEDGKMISRRRFTGNKKKFDLIYNNLSAADKILLESMQETVGVGADTISWTNEDPNDSSTYTVRLSTEGILFDIKPSDYNLHSARFTFIEA